MTIIKQIILLIIILIVSNILVFIYCFKKGMHEFILYANNLFNTKIKIINSKNINNFRKDRLLIMANHFNGTDYLSIAQVFNNLNKNKKLYTVAFSHILTNDINKNILTNTAAIFNDYFFKLNNLLPYKKGNKNSGQEIKEKILKAINENNTVLIFPEGTSTIKGIPESFKPGSFELCKNNNISILPLTIKYNKNIGVNQNQNANFLNWFNFESTIYIHDIITPQSCIDSTEMMNKTLEVIRYPLI